MPSRRRTSPLQQRGTWTRRRTTLPRLEPLERRDLLATLGVPLDHPTIAAAIEAADAGDTILVAAGIYDENLVVAKDVRIQGAGMDQTTIRGTDAKTPVVAITNASPVLLDVTLTGGKNGGLQIEDGSPVVRNTRIVDNIRESAGGGIYVSGDASPWILDSQILNNRHYQGPGHAGGFGGGIYYAGGEGGVIAGNLISGNNAWARGGAIYIAGSPLIYDNDLFDNRGDYTGGVHIVSGTPTIQANRIAGNRHDYQPVQSAGLTVTGGSARIVNNTLHQNSSGIYVGGSASDVLVINNLVSSNSEDGIRAEVPVTLAYNNVFGQPQNYAGAHGGPGEGSFSQDPLFQDPANRDFHLQTGSPAHHAGHPDPSYNNPDGTRNTLGDTGGPNPLTPTITAVADTAELGAQETTRTLDVLANDTTWPDENLALQVVASTPGAAGGATRIVANRVEYTRPSPDFLGVDTFSYTVSDGTPGNQTTAEVTVYVDADYLPATRVQLLETIAQAQIRYFTSPLSNNLAAGFTHSWFGTGPWRECNPGCEIQPSNLPRGQGSHVVPNEITLGFNVLAAGFQSGWLDHLAADQRWNRSWGQVRTGLRTLRGMQTSNNDDQFRDGAFYRAYKTVNPAQGDIDLLPQEIVKDGDEQSADDNGLLVLNLLTLRGLALDASVELEAAFRAEVVELIDAIIRDVDLRRFVVDDRIVFNFTRDAAGNAVPSTASWDRLSAEGGALLAALLVTENITLEEFERILPSLENHPVVWNTANRGPIEIRFPSYHAAGFMHAIRQMHGLPVTEAEASGVRYFADSLKPVFEVQVDYAHAQGLQSVGSQVMTQPFGGTPLFEQVANPGVQAQFPGNESGVPPQPGSTLSAATAPHGLFQPLARFRELRTADILQLFDWIQAYVPGFFRSGSDTELGFPAAIPWTPDDRTHTWSVADQVFYTDHGNPFEALTSAYLILSIFDALNPDAPLSSYNAQAGRLAPIAAKFDTDQPLPADLFEKAGLEILQTAGTTELAEGGPEDQYQVRLTSKPIAEVQLTLQPGPRLAASPNRLVFTPDNWDQPQTVRVSAPSDGETNGSSTIALAHSAASLDPNYHQIPLTTLDVLVNDQDDLASWVVRSGQAGSSPDDAFHSVQVDRAGNLVLAGATMGFSDSGSFPSDADVLVEKYAVDGSLLWRYQVGHPDLEGDNLGDDDERAASVAVDEQGNVYVVGSFRGSSVDFDPLRTHPDDEDILPNAGAFDGFLLKLDAAGTFQWVVGLGGDAAIWDRGAGVAASQGEVFVSGTFAGTVDFDTRQSPADGGDLLTAHGRADTYVARYDSQGRFLAAAAMGGAEQDSASGLLVTEDAIYVLGTFQGEADFDPDTVDPLGRDLRQSAGGSDGFLAAFRRNLDFLWVSAVGGPGYQQITGLDAGPGGELFASGYFQGAVDFDDGSGAHTATSIDGGFDPFWMQISPTGEVRWVSVAGTAGDDRATGIAVGSESIWVSGYGASRQGFVRRLAMDGNALSEVRIAGAGTANPLAVVTDPAGNLFTAGSFQGEVAVETATETLPLVAASPGRDAFVTRLTAASAQANARPTITSPGDVRSLEDQASGPHTITIGDRETEASQLEVTATSSNPILLPPENITWAGSGAERSVSWTPAENQSGTAEVTLTVRDTNGQTGSATFSYVVEAVNDPPTITSIADQSTLTEVPVGPLSVTIGDVETAPEELLLSATSSNEELLPLSGIEFTGSGTGRFVTLRPAANQFGQSVVVLSVEDGQGETVSTSFQLNVQPAEDVVRIVLQAVDAEGQPLSFISVGGRFQLVVSVEDVRPNPTGVFAAFVDITFASERLAAIAPIHHADRFSNETSGSVSAGRIDELGGISSELDPPGGGPFPLATIPMSANSLGTVVLQSGPANEAGHELLVYGNRAAVPVERVEFVPLALEVIESSSPWQNPADRFDVTADGLVAPIDVLVGINRINSSGDGPLPTPGAIGPPPFFDVNGDNFHSAADMLAVINFLNSRAAGEQEGAGGEQEGSSGEGESVLPEESRPAVLVRFGSRLDPDRSLATTGTTFPVRRTGVESARAGMRPGPAVHLAARLPQSPDATALPRPRQTAWPKPDGARPGAASGHPRLESAEWEQLLELLAAARSPGDDASTRQAGPF